MFGAHLYWNDYRDKKNIKEKVVNNEANETVTWWVSITLQGKWCFRFSLEPLHIRKLFWIGTTLYIIYIENATSIVLITSSCMFGVYILLYVCMEWVQTCEKCADRNIHKHTHAHTHTKLLNKNENIPL